MRIVSSVIGMSSVISRLPVGPNARGPPKGQPSTPYAQPVEVGAFSRDRAGGVHYDRRSLRRYDRSSVDTPAKNLGGKRVIQRRFSVSVPRARVPGKASARRARSER